MLSYTYFNNHTCNPNSLQPSHSKVFDIPGSHFHLPIYWVYLKAQQSKANNSHHYSHQRLHLRDEINITQYSAMRPVCVFQLLFLYQKANRQGA